jgi:hypothetical protein
VKNIGKTEKPKKSLGFSHFPNESRLLQAKPKALGGHGMDLLESTIDMGAYQRYPKGKRLHSYGKSPSAIGK